MSDKGPTFQSLRAAFLLYTHSKAHQGRCLMNAIWKQQISFEKIKYKYRHQMHYTVGTYARNNLIWLLNVLLYVGAASAKSNKNNLNHPDGRERSWW